MNIRDLINNDRIISTDLLNRIQSSKLPLEDISIDVLNLSKRPHNALVRSNIDSLDKLIRLTDFDLARMHNVGVLTFQEIVEKTNSYLEKITKPQELDSFFRTSLYKLLEVQKLNLGHTEQMPLASSNQILIEATPLTDILSNDISETILSFGLSSSLDIWVIALGHYLNISPVYTKLIEEISKYIAGPWQIKEKTAHCTTVQAIHIPSMMEKIVNAFTITTHSESSRNYLRILLSIKVSPESTLNWEALLPFNCLNQKISWRNNDDKTKGLCTFLIRTSNVKHWAEPPTQNWSYLPRTRADHAFNSWIFSIRSHSINRNYEIFKEWFGLASGERKTLEEAGSKYNITRERVRQIVSRFIKLLLHPSRKKYLVPFISQLDMVFGQHGHIMTLREITNSCKFFDDFKQFSALHLAELVLMGCNKYTAIDYNCFKNKLDNLELGWVTWFTNEINPEEIRKSRETATQLVIAKPFEYNINDLINTVSTITDVNKDTVRASLRTYRSLQDSGLGYTHTTNGEKRLTVSQMITIAMKELMVPAHYSVIHKKICEIFPGQNIDIGTLRNTLNSGQFLIVDRGIYGLLNNK